MIKTKPAHAPNVIPSSPVEPSEFQGGIGGLFIVEGKNYRQVGTAVHWRLLYEATSNEMLGAVQRVEIEAERIWLKELPQTTLNILLFRRNLVYVVAQAYIEGIKDSENAEWQQHKLPWDGFVTGPWVIRSNLMVPPIPAMRCDSWDKAIKHGNKDKLLEIITLAETWERLRKEREAQAR